MDPTPSKPLDYATSETPVTLIRANLGSRVLANLIDIPAIGIPPAFFWFAFYFINPGLPSREGFLLVAGAFLLMSLLDVFAAGTPGKRFLRLRIRDAEGPPARVSQLLGRWLLKFSPILVFLAVEGIERFDHDALERLSLILHPKNDRYVFEVIWLFINSLVLLSAVSCLWALGAHRQTLIERLTGTAVYRIAPTAPRVGLGPHAL